MRLTALWFWIALLNGIVPTLCLGRPLTVVNQEFCWFSPSIEEDSGSPRIDAPGWPSGHIGLKSYRNHFDKHGEQPLYDFLAPLVKTEPKQASLEQHHIIFPMKSVPLKTLGFPQDAKPAKPYLLSTPAGDYVIAVHPYFKFMDKEALYFTAIYSKNGDLLMETDSLPTHACLDAPHVLVSAQRSGCCESLRWTVHFYDLRSKSNLMLGCPEGRCGNFLFLRLSSRGPFLVAYEILTMLPDVGYAVQTDIHLISDDLAPRASAQILFAARKADFPTILPERQHLYSVSNLASVTPLPGSYEWAVSFNNHLQQNSFRLTSREGQAPVPVFLTSRNAPSMITVSYDGRSLGKLPLILISEPGEYSVTLNTNGGSPHEFKFTALPDGSNFVTCE